MTPDDQRMLLLILPWIFSVKYEAEQYVKGIAFHWYYNYLVPPSFLTYVHHSYPDKFILATEACEGSQPFQKHVVLGSWKRGETYAQDIIEVILFLPQELILI